MSFLAAICSRIVGWFVLFVARGEVKKVEQAISDKSDEIVAKNDIEALKRAETHEAKTAILRKIADDSFGSSDSGSNSKL